MAGGTYVPLSGVTRSNDGSLLALEGLVSDPSQIVPPTVSGLSFTSDSVAVNTFSVTAELMASVGFPGLTVSGQSNVVYYVVDIAATSTIPGTSQGPIASWVLGVGIRIAVRGISVTGSAAVSLSNLAASASLNGTSTSFEFDAIGLGFPVMGLMKGLVDQSLTGFDVSTLQELGNVLNDLTTFMANPANASSLQPQVMGVIFSSANFAVSAWIPIAAATYGFSLRAIQQGLTAQQALQQDAVKLPPDVSIDPDIINAVYGEIVGSDPSIVPNSAQKSLAKQLTQSGP